MNKSHLSTSCIITEAIVTEHHIHNGYSILVMILSGRYYYFFLEGEETYRKLNEYVHKI
jgi:hypothetical protein